MTQPPQDKIFLGRPDHKHRIFLLSRPSESEGLGRTPALAAEEWKGSPSAPVAVSGILMILEWLNQTLVLIKRNRSADQCLESYRINQSKAQMNQVSKRLPHPDSPAAPTRTREQRNYEETQFVPAKQGFPPENSLGGATVTGAGALDVQGTPQAVTSEGPKEPGSPEMRTQTGAGGART